MTSILTGGIVDHLDNAFRIAVDFSTIERTHANGHFNGRHFDLINDCYPNRNNHSPEEQQHSMQYPAATLSIKQDINTINKWGPHSREREITNLFFDSFIILFYL